MSHPTRHRFARAGLAVLLTAATIGPGVAAAGSNQEPAGRTAKRPASQGYEQFQVAAGTTLAIELRTRLASNTNRRTDLVEGRLLRAITAGDVELVPAGATVIGTVSDVEPAAPKKPARLAFTFHVIEHPQTGSRATIRAAARAFQSERPVKGKVYTDVTLDKGLDASVLLLAPLVVRLPVAN